RQLLRGGALDSTRIHPQLPRAKRHGHLLRGGIQRSGQHRTTNRCFPAPCYSWLSTLSVIATDDETVFSSLPTACFWICFISASKRAKVGAKQRPDHRQYCCRRQ